MNFKAAESTWHRIHAWMLDAIISVVGLACVVFVYLHGAQLDRCLYSCVAYIIFVYLHGAQLYCCIYSCSYVYDIKEENRT